MLFTDGRDSASWLDNEDVLEAARGSSRLLHVMGTEAFPDAYAAARPAQGRVKPDTESGYVYLLTRAAGTTSRDLLAR